jgi:pimeloyl-ACP methyl ester carboxylesterase
MGEKLWKAARLVVSGVLAITLVLVGSGLLYRAWRQHQADNALVLHATNGIDEAMFVPINSTPQWITIRGHDRKNPVVLMLHGGPGVTNDGFAVSFMPWEKDFTVVQWDQPGAGRTLERAGSRFPSGLTIDGMADDGVGVAEFLRTHLHKDKLILLGWSWGSILGVRMVQVRPDLFAAYVGTGQFVNVQAGESIAYAGVLATARAKSNRHAVEELESIGPPPYKSQVLLGIQRKWAMTFENGTTPIGELAGLALFAPRTSLVDGWSFLSGVVASQNRFLGRDMDGEMTKVDLTAGAVDFAIPFFIIQGAEDDVTPGELARAYVGKISAPQKAYIPIEGAGHLALITHTNEFLRVMNERVRALATERGSGEAPVN